MKKKHKDINIEIKDHSVVCYIDNLSDGLKSLIKDHLRNICHGKNLISKGLDLHSYKNTLTQFKQRYHEKTDEIKKGMMGELLAHVLIYEYLDKFDVISPFFNMEEKSQRKGFDLLLVSKSDNDVWITEVKSGEVGKKASSDVAVRSFLHTAKRDLKLRLNQAEETFWTNAINTANNVIEDCSDYKDAIIRILDSEGVLAIKDEADSKNNNVILISVLFHDIKDKFDENIVESLAKSISKEDIFKKCDYIFNPKRHL